MPELPEVEVVRRGVERWTTGRTVRLAEALHPRAVRRHPGGAGDFRDRLAGRVFGRPERRGKFLWIPLDGGGDALLGHLGMSGQLLVQDPGHEDEIHLRVRFTFTDGGRELRFVDQRTFGGLAVEELVEAPGGGTVPASVAHIARDPLDPLFSEDGFHAALAAKRTGIKRALLDQSLISGVGNIYADEALWRARLHYERPTQGLRAAESVLLLAAVREVMTEALAVGGTSFDAMYVNVNGESGYFSRDLNAYGRTGEPCARCGTGIRRAAFMNRSSFFCPSCQIPAPRAAAD